MNTGIDILDNPNSDPLIQRQIIQRGILDCQSRVNQWKRGPRRGRPSVIAQIREYSARMETLKSALA